MRELADAATEAEAMKLQARADRITKFRGDNAKYLGGAIAISERGWGTTLLAAAGVVSDWYDGYLAKKAQKMVGATEALTDGHIEDPKSDKKFRAALFFGIAMRAARERDVETLAVVGGVHEVSGQRDERIAKSRDIATRYDLDVGVGAINKSRIKTAIELTSLVVHVSPLARNQLVRRAALTGLASGTAIGISSERDYTGMVYAELSERAAACPDVVRSCEEPHLTVVPAYTTPELETVVVPLQPQSAVPPVHPRAAQHS